MKVTPGKAEPGRFASLTSMVSDQLTISPDYVDADQEGGTDRLLAIRRRARWQ